MQRGLVQRPRRTGRPVRVLELVLHVEEEHARRAGQRRRRRLGEQEVDRADQEADSRDQRSEDDVGRPGAALEARARVLGDHPRLDDQAPQPAEAEHDQRVAEGAVAGAHRPVVGHVLVQGHRRDVAGPAPVEVAGGGVVHRVAVAPGLERGEDDDADDRPEDVVAALGRQERPVRAVVEDDVGPQQEAGGRDRQRQDGPERGPVAQERDLQHHQREVGDDGGGQVEQAARDAGLRIGRDRGLPRSSVGAHGFGDPNTKRLKRGEVGPQPFGGNRYDACGAIGA